MGWSLCAKSGNGSVMSTPCLSEVHFWCLVFTERPLPHIHDPDRFLLNWRRDAAARAAETMTPVTASYSPASGRLPRAKCDQSL